MSERLHLDALLDALDEKIACDEGISADEISAIVRAIDAVRDDDEVAHGAEDRLYRLTLQAIANGNHDADVLAEEALMATGLAFARWCA